MFWSKIFAISFGMGVVTGIPMSFQFGTNFAKFSQFTAPVIGPLLSIEILTAFFLEAVFIGIMLFGWKKVHPLIHLFATLFVVVGTHNSALWILIVNSWMQTPAGVEIVNGVLNVTSWKDVILNPSAPYRVIHMVLASYVSSIFVILGVSASYIKINKDNELAKKAFKMAILILAVLTPTQIIAGDLHGLNTLKHQPVKVAAMEGNWDVSSGTPLILFAIPDSKNETNHLAVKIPKATSLILTHHLDGEVPTLKSWPKEERPMVGVVFWAFRIMVGMGFLMLLMVFVGLFLMYKKKLYSNNAYLKLLQFMIPVGFVAVISGWCVTEVGRQPWAVYGLLKIADSHSPITTSTVAFSLTFFVILYTFLALAYAKFAKLLYKKGITPFDTNNLYKTK